MKDIKRHLFGLFLSVLIFIVSCDSKQQCVSLSKLKPNLLNENGAEIFEPCPWALPCLHPENMGPVPE